MPKDCPLAILSPVKDNDLGVDAPAVPVVVPAKSAAFKVVFVANCPVPVTSQPEVLLNVHCS